jgi:cytochrome c553
MGASEIINKFNTYKTMDPRADIMYVHAQAYTAEEIQLIANFFSKQQ